tara:strand:+ start:766 stop:1440 length:675 start_codon:yes stop_codon:yes gene_type:complete
MKNLSNVDIHTFLSRCDRRFVEQRTMEYEGKTYAIPYSTVTIQDTKIKGLRENEKRLELYEKLINEHTTGRKSFLDVGCNLGVFVRYFSDMFEEVKGVDNEPYYNGQSRFLFPDIADSFVLNDINFVGLADLLKEPFDVITSNSMFEYINDKHQFAKDLCSLTKELCIVEGHSEDIVLGHDVTYEAILREQDWTVTRIEEVTDAGINAPQRTQATGRPVWLCQK